MSAKLIEFRKCDSTEPLVTIKPTQYPTCEHSRFVVDEKNRTVECGLCKRPLDAMHVLVLIAGSERMRRWITESKEQYDQKAVAKTIKAAVIALGKRSITPDKFAQLYDAYRADMVEKNKISEVPR